MGTTKTAKRTLQKERLPSTRKELRISEERLRKLLAANESNAYKIGHLFDQIARSGLYLEIGFASLDSYANARFTQGYRTLRRYRRVALAFAEATVIKHGITKLDLGLTYLGAVGKRAKPAALLGLDIRVPDDNQGTRNVPFSSITYDDLVRAVSAVSLLPHHDDPRLDKLAASWQATFQAAVAAPKGQFRHAPLVRVRPHAKRPGVVRVDVLGIDLDDVARVARALAREGVRAKDEAPESPSAETSALATTKARAKSTPAGPAHKTRH
jgi:hypothetical protein